jgi:hypothetical protein
MAVSSQQNGTFHTFLFVTQHSFCILLQSSRRSVLTNVDSFAKFQPNINSCMYSIYIYIYIHIYIHTYIIYTHSPCNIHNTYKNCIDFALSTYDYTKWGWNWHMFFVLVVAIFLGTKNVEAWICVYIIRFHAHARSEIFLIVLHRRSCVCKTWPTATTVFIELLFAVWIISRRSLLATFHISVCIYLSLSRTLSRTCFCLDLCYACFCPHACIYSYNSYLTDFPSEKKWK